MQAFDPNAIAALSVPVLCIDTCSLLDIMRDPTRDSTQARDRLAAIDLVKRLESLDLVCLVAEQVEMEFGSHDTDIQLEAENAIRKLRERVDQVNQIHATFLSAVKVDLTHLDNVVAPARQIITRWTNAAHRVSSSPAIYSKAMYRVNQGIAPARKGKDSVKDCVVVETYLSAVDDLRTARMPTNVVFLSSNTKEYRAEGKTLHPDLVTDFSNINITYAPNMSAAKALLGF
ncbi:MAG: PIN domain-containing protein [Acetobacter sp.]|uniref:PIN domain-containing protein n=1 Tax=Acetobacter fabarum TaxID=483199 RepID=UPI0024328D38|nr:PIN domain-containing protein [Acetobacter fabarum]MCH4024814.1 PIN domain-containing protein [Acetobacter fabarum]MCH4059835.1 PIN domain-containing protein [Acetobacter sp.]